jgi:Mn2+/Fe2+ NRAMP family transporter
MNNILKKIGPGLLFASSSIGTSHLVLSTRAGAHHGMIYIWIIILCLLMKYPFFEFAPRYVSATGHSLLRGYRKQGKWAIIMFMLIIGISMFAVVGAVGAVSAGILSTMLHVNISMPVLFGGLLALTAALLALGGYKALDIFIKWLSALLFIAVCIAFIAVIFKGPVQPVEGFVAPPILEGAGLALLISLLGWMPTGMEASAMHSFWILEKEKVSGLKANLKELLFDFKLGYWMTVILALMFALIGSFTVFGSGNLLEGSSTDISNQLLQIFVTNIGSWSYPIIVIAAFGTIYGTLITAWDAFARGFIRSLRALIFSSIEKNQEQEDFLSKYYKVTMITIGIGGFLLFILSQTNMIKMLEGATIFSFVAGPIIAYLNLKSVQSDDVPLEDRPPRWMIILAWAGIVLMVAFAAYYLYTLITHGSVGH